MRRIPVLLVAAVLVVSGACSDVTPYAAKVNGEAISVDELNTELEAVRGNRAYQEALSDRLPAIEGVGAGTFTSAFVAQTLTTRIFYKLIEQEVARRKLPISDEEIARAREELDQEEAFSRFPRQFLDRLARLNAAVTVLQEALEQPVTDQQVEEFYRQNQQFFRQFCVAQIVTGGFSGDAPPPPDQEAAARAAADDIKRRLDTGQDFAAIARAESKDTATAANGGDLGCVAENALPPDAREAVAGAQPGQVVGPIRTDRGFYLIKVASTTTQPLEQVAGQIRQFLESQAGNALNEFLRSALAEADIVVNPRYGRFDPERPGVVPPDVPATSTTAPEEEAPAP